VKLAAALLAWSLTLTAQSLQKIDYSCPHEDQDSFGLACSDEEPCAVFLDLAAVDWSGARLFVAGNLHTAATTLWGIVLSSEDGGKTWTEPVKRLRAAALEQIQFLDFSTGWISGQIIEPLPRDPFFLLTTDGGKTWRQRAVFEDSRVSSVAGFWFTSRTEGELVLDHTQGSTTRHEVYESKTGGESWEPKEVTTSPVKAKGAAKNDLWRLRADAASKTYLVEQRVAAGWDTVASFPIHVADCK
jgi:photosystem II stability/assembly factor-like uncharacterized protein